MATLGGQKLEFRTVGLKGSLHKLDMSHVDRLNMDCRHWAVFTYRQGYHFVLIFKGNVLQNVNARISGKRGYF